MTNKEIVLALIDRINAYDLNGLAELMTDDHCFIDAHGNEVFGREKMIAAWRGYFEWFPRCSTRRPRVPPQITALDFSGVLNNFFDRVVI